MFKKVRITYTVTYRDGDDIRVTKVDRHGLNNLLIGIDCIGGEVIEVVKEG
jgi:hypothetical protein